MIRIALAILILFPWPAEAARTTVTRSGPNGIPGSYLQGIQPAQVAPKTTVIAYRKTFAAPITRTDGTLIEIGTYIFYRCYIDGRLIYEGQALECSYAREAPGSHEMKFVAVDLLMNGEPREGKPLVISVVR